MSGDQYIQCIGWACTLRELHGPEALAVYEDWKARKE